MRETAEAFGFNQDYLEDLRPQTVSTYPEKANEPETGQTGIGGAVAETVGKLMRALGRDRQVLAVTHLAQVAAHADRHLVVRKSTDGEVTSSDVMEVQGEDRLAELARMMGGAGTDAGLRHAEELLRACSG